MNARPLGFRQRLPGVFNSVFATVAVIVIGLSIGQRDQKACSRGYVIQQFGQMPNGDAHARVVSRFDARNAGPDLVRVGLIHLFDAVKLTAFTGHA